MKILFALKIVSAKSHTTQVLKNIHAYKLYSLLEEF